MIRTEQAWNRKEQSIRSPWSGILVKCHYKAPAREGPILQVHFKKLGTRSRGLSSTPQERFNAPQIPSTRPLDVCSECPRAAQLTAPQDTALAGRDLTADVQQGELDEFIQEHGGRIYICPYTHIYM